MPKVWNQRDPNVPNDAVYVGRPTIWGNPYMIGVDGSREEVVEKYRRFIIPYVVANPENLKALRGKDLVCWCAPKKCHADILLEMANAD